MTLKPSNTPFSSCNVFFTGYNQNMVSQSDLAKITEIFSSHDYVKKVILFGSYANGSMKQDSDIDIMILVDNSIANIRTVIEQFYIELNEFLNVPCDIMVEYEQKFLERSSFPTIERTIAREGRILYAAQGYCKRMAGKS
ncbi:MAG: nucleotidyltransferase domain-containing protein [Spirochaetales bacterium]|nr:nucleotidyltransferase domain-containing protein [Spirochaetales bacterium]